jgi:DNA-3-methyladenine glycosylase I
MPVIASGAMAEPNPVRCAWAGSDPLYVAYHDHEWGVPVHDDRKLFEMLILEGAQAGLAWITILRRREGYLQAFDRFDPEKVARYGPDRIAALLADRRIVRNRAKVEAAVGNARAFLEIRDRHEGGFAPWIWRFAGGAPQTHHFHHLKEIPAETAESKAMSKELKKHGFRFVGPTICYAFMQAVGMVNDHTTDCFRHPQI